MITKVCSGDETIPSALVSVRCFLPRVACSCRLLLPSLCCCLLLLVFCPPAFAQTGAWARQRLSTLAWLHSVFFLDQNRGWAVGSKGTMLVTIDAGKSWQAKSSPTGDVLLDIYFTDEQNGWLVCETNVYELKTKDDPRTYLMQTSDGGHTGNKSKSAVLMLTLASFGRFLGRADAVGFSVKKVPSLRRATRERAGLVYKHLRGICSWVACLLTKIADGWWERAPP